LYRNATQTLSQGANAGQFQKFKCIVWANGFDLQSKMTELWPSQFGLSIWIKYEGRAWPQSEFISFTPNQPGWINQEAIFDVDQDKAVERYDGRRELGSFRIFD